MTAFKFNMPRIRDPACVQAPAKGYVKTPEKPLGFVKPAAAPAGERSRGAFAPVRSHVHLPLTKAPAAPVVIRRDAGGHPTLSADDIPFD
jgi:hypothetical protein